MAPPYIIVATAHNSYINSITSIIWLDNSSIQILIIPYAPIPVIADDIGTDIGVGETVYVSGNHIWKNKTLILYQTHDN